MRELHKQVMAQTNLPYLYLLIMNKEHHHCLGVIIFRLTCWENDEKNIKERKGKGFVL